jgi:hypothetical protein
MTGPLNKETTDNLIVSSFFVVLPTPTQPYQPHFPARALQALGSVPLLKKLSITSFLTSATTRNAWTMPTSVSQVILSGAVRSKVLENKSPLSVSNELVLAGPKTALLPLLKPEPLGSATSGMT